MHRVLPDPALSLSFWCRRGTDGRSVEPRLVIIGPKTQPHIFALRRGYEIAAVRLKLEWVEPLLGLVPAEHNDAKDDLSPILPRFAGPLLDTLAETRTCGQAAAMIATALAQQARREPASRPEVLSGLAPSQVYRERRAQAEISNRR